MLNEKEIDYYSRQILLDDFGLETQECFKSASVLVVGAGGLGCPTLQYLVGVGVGKIGIVDGDKVEISNLHRQVLFGYSDLGKMKCEAAKERLTDLNPHILIESFPVFLDTLNVKSIIENYDIVVDCTDNYPTRFLVNDVCVWLNKPLVYGSIYRFEGQVSVFNYQGGPTYRCLFPELPSAESTTNCVAAGVIGILPGIIGLFQANEVIKLISGKGEVLSGKIFLYNARQTKSMLLELKRDETIDYQKLIFENGPKLENYGLDCAANLSEIQRIDKEDLLLKIPNEDLLFVDVRELGEVPVFDDLAVQRIPMSTLDTMDVKWPKDKTIIVFCKSGIRSEKFIRSLSEKTNSGNFYNLNGGINELIIEAWKQRKK